MSDDNAIPGGGAMTCSGSCASREPEALRDVVNSLCPVLALSKESRTLADLRFLSHALCVLVRLPKAIPSVLRFNRQTETIQFTIGLLMNVH